MLEDIVAIFGGGGNFDQERVKTNSAPVPLLQ